MMQLPTTKGLDMTNTTLDLQPTRTSFLTVLRGLRKDGVAVKQNVSGCCRSCISADSEARLGLEGDDETTPYAWTFGGQGGKYQWVDDALVYSDSVRKTQWGYNTPKRVESVYFNHGNGGGQRLADALRTAGFTVEWDGSQMQCVVIKFLVTA